MFRFGALVLSLVMFLFAAAALAARPSGSLRMAISSDEGTLTPYTYVTGYPGYELMTLIYDQLFLMDADLNPQPWLAESLTIADDVTYHVTLKEGLTWQDGTPLTANDVAFSLAYYQTNLHGRWTPLANRVTSVVVVDERNVSMVLAAPDAAFVETVLADLPILPQHVWAEVSEPRTMTEAMGSGPYMVAEYRVDQFYRLAANPNFWGPAPVFDTIFIPIIRDQTATFQALQVGDIDVATRTVPPELVERFAGNANIVVAQGPGFASTTLKMNVTHGALVYPDVRQVIAQSINYPRLVETLLLGYGTAGTPGFLHPASPFANPNTQAYAQLSTAEARARLEQLGFSADTDGIYSDAEGNRLEFELLAPSNNPIRLRAAELIAQDLGAVGIRINVRSMEAEALTQRVWPDFDVSKGRNYQMAIFGWSAPVNARANLRGLLHSDPTKGTLNVTGYANAAIDRLTDQAVITIDGDARRQLLYEVQEILARELPFITLFYQDGIFAYRPAVFDAWVYMAGQGIINKRSFVTQ